MSMRGAKGAKAAGRQKSAAASLLASGQAARALELLEPLCRSRAGDAEAWMLLGCAHGALGDSSQAIRCLSRAVRLQPSLAAAHSNLGIALKTAGRLGEAVESYRRAIRLEPDNASFHGNLGNALAEQGKLDEAVKALSRAVALRPNDASLHYNLGNVLRERGSLSGAADAYRKALELRPDLHTARNSLGNVLTGMGKLEQAMQCYEAVLAEVPGSLDALCGKVRVLDKQGRFDEALELVSSHMEAKVPHAAMAATFAEMAHHVSGEDKATDWLEHLLAKGGWSPKEALRLYFALGKLHDRAGRYDEAFAQYRAAHALYAVDFDIEEFSQLVDALIDVFSRNALDSSPGSGLQDDTPIFIVGMPRSGTTLVEQILASHPRIGGGGERDDIAVFVQSLAEGGGEPYPAGVRALSPDRLREFAGGYLKRLRSVSPQARYVTDKMPHNFLHLGLIQLLFPKARVIHCVRDPRDTCLSCYFQNFSGYHPYVHDLATLGRYYCEYQRLMRHWESVVNLPLMRVRYEDLIANQEKVTRELIDFCGLEWDDACLRFHANRRTTTTSSYDQVRQPLYSRSIGRWKHYQHHLGPLIEALARCATE